MHATTEQARPAAATSAATPADGAGSPPVADFRHMRRVDVARFGGKNASLGELIAVLDELHIEVPAGFATSADAFRRYVRENDLGRTIDEAVASLENRRETLQEIGARVRTAFLAGEWPADVEAAIRVGYRALCQRLGRDDVDVAVRSSATAEDLPDASFAGQQETFLNVRGEDAVLDACRRCYASLYTDRAISYRTAKGYAHADVALSVGVQAMVRSDIGGSGVMFTLDTETGFEDVIVIDAAWGLGETVVQGSVDPDEYRVYKPFLQPPATGDAALVPIIGKRLGAKEIKMVYADLAPTVRTVTTSLFERDRWVLSDDEILELARAAAAIERHYGCPMDIEWAKDGRDERLYIVQARPETVQSRRDVGSIRRYRLGERGAALCSGVGIGNAAVAGRVCLIDDPADIERFVDGAVLVTTNTDPDWVPIMKRAAAIVTDHGGRTSHAAIVSRELGLPAIVGTGDATYRLHDGQDVTVSCVEGDEGTIYEGLADIAMEEVSLDDIPATDTKVMLNLANPGAATRWWALPADGVGLARMEFVISNHVKVHPMALVRFDELPAGEERDRIAALSVGYADRTDYFVETLARGLAQIASVAYPKPVIVRLSDFKTNEYANLLGGARFEPHEENPMIGFRGASRYHSDAYRDGFALECRAIRRLRETLGFDDVIVMVPFCRTLDEADRVLATMAQHGLERGRNGLQVYVMGEVPSNVVLAAQFAKRFDGFSIGSNDLTQLTLGVDRDSELLSAVFDEDDAAVRWMISHLIREAHAAGAKVGLCGQAPSDRPEFARFLVEAGIDSISVTPDSFLEVKRHVADAERERAARVGSEAPVAAGKPA